MIEKKDDAGNGNDAEGGNIKGGDNDNDVEEGDNSNGIKEGDDNNGVNNDVDNGVEKGDVEEVESEELITDENSEVSRDEYKLDILFDEDGEKDDKELNTGTLLLLFVKSESDSVGSLLSSEIVGFCPRFNITNDSEE
ncbi:12191_t:CDS:2 [Ambispora gerdemannii]|uniref:12191_t:CDS:1 n=1 Tax=Ambispora gerdemannii TaxID=144530 RepID=A0A9N9E3X9_9GLOM|nr:12191_t:CDS:2 [Ambispora gerdemannii]